MKLRNASLSSLVLANLFISAALSFAALIALTALKPDLSILSNTIMTCGGVLLLTAALFSLFIHRALKPVTAVSDTALKWLQTSAVSKVSNASASLPADIAALASAFEAGAECCRAMRKADIDFMERAAHELRMPLATLMLEAGKVSGPNGRRIEDDTKRLDDTISTLLELTRLERLHTIVMGTVDLLSVANDAVFETCELAGKYSATVRIIRSTVSDANGDHTMLVEALIELIENAIKHNGAGVILSILFCDGPTIMIADNGKGFGSDANRLLQPFARGAYSSGHSGMGLAVVKRIVELHLGQIDLDASESGGALVRIKLPAAGTENCGSKHETAPVS